ncbi:MAG: ribonuclease HII [Rikenellaceae bacterium]
MEKLEFPLTTSFQVALIEAGCDEAGRGCLAGDLFAAAVILPAGFSHPHLNDSKKMSLRRRNELRHIIEQEAIAWAVEPLSAARIDEINILNASFEAMSMAVKRLSTTPELLSIDGNRFKTELQIPFNCIVKGDGKYANIAAASVLAKTYRDEYMERIDEEYPQYGWKKNKGYPTLQHRLAIAEHGLSPYHRLSFNSGVGQLKIEF